MMTRLAIYLGGCMGISVALMIEIYYWINDALFCIVLNFLCMVAGILFVYIIGRASYEFRHRKDM